MSGPRVDEYMGTFDKVVAGTSESIEESVTRAAVAFIETITRNPESDYQHEFAYFANAYNLDTPKRKARLSLTVAHLAYPMQNKQRYYSITYYNPTKIRLHVAPLGLYDDAGNLIAYLEPDADIQIPEPYTKGGKASVLYTNVPQLKLRATYRQEDTLLDLNPVCYEEWIKYLPSRSSPCCKRIVTWSDFRNGLMCLKCEKKINII